jgi:hypothetical protein
MSLQEYLKKLLPKGYPKVRDIDKYLAWDDDRVLQSMVKRADWEEVGHLTARRFPRMVYQTGAHTSASEWEKYVRVKAELDRSGLCQYFEDDASKLPHNIPSIALSDEKGVYLLKDGRTTNIQTSSYVLNQIKESINVHRLYVPCENKMEIRKFIRALSL